MVGLVQTIEECWDQDAEARLTAQCVAERVAQFHSLSNCGSEHSPVVTTVVNNTNITPSSKESTIWTQVNIAIQGLCSDRTRLPLSQELKIIQIDKKNMCAKQQMDTRVDNMFFIQWKGTVCLLLISECVLVTTFQIYVYADQFRTCFVWSCVVRVSFAMQMRSEIDGSEEYKNLHISKHLMLKVWLLVYGLCFKINFSVKTGTYHCCTVLLPLLFTCHM